MEELNEAQARAISATGALVSRWGVQKTTFGEVATQAGMSRASLYRAFPGGRDQLLATLLAVQVNGFFTTVITASRDARTLAEAFATALHSASYHLESNPVARFVLVHEPGLVVPILGFGEADKFLLLASRELSPCFVRFLANPADAAWAAEWIARLFLSRLVSHVAGAMDVSGTVVESTESFDFLDRGVCDEVASMFLAPAFLTLDQ